MNQFAKTFLLTLIIGFASVAGFIFLVQKIRDVDSVPKSLSYDKAITISNTQGRIVYEFSDGVYTPAETREQLLIIKAEAVKILRTELDRTKNYISMLELSRALKNNNIREFEEFVIAHRIQNPK